VQKGSEAHEASQTQGDTSLASPVNVARYFNPPHDTVYPLEYAFHLLGDVRGKTIVEYGCGDGVNTVLVANRAAKVISLDLSLDLMQRLCTKRKEGFTR
jgi:hypothetical protein